MKSYELGETLGSEAFKVSHDVKRMMSGSGVYMEHMSLKLIIVAHRDVI